MVVTRSDGNLATNPIEQSLGFEVFGLRVNGRIVRLPFNFSVAHVDHALRVPGDFVFVRDYENRLSVLVEFNQQGHDVGGGFRIEIAGRFIRQQQRWIGDERACDGDPLTLPTR